MALEPNLREQELIAEAYDRRAQTLSRTERRAEAVVSGAFVLAAAALLVAFPPALDQWHVFAAAGCFLALVFALRVEFDTGSGWTVPSQLAFVPLLFTMPPVLAPVAVLAALVIAKLPDVARGWLRASRLLRFPGSAWFSIGPAAVLSAAHVSSVAEAAPLVLVAALAAQLIGDFGASALIERLLHGASVRDQLREAWVYAIDIALTPLGLLIASHVDDTPWAPLALLPLLAVLATFARERRGRVKGLVELNHAYRGIARVLGDVVEADDTYTGEHSRDVVTLAVAVADRLGAAPDRRRNLELAALLHDVGKVAIPKDIINKPGKLDAAEWKIIRTHTIEGQKILDRVGGFMSDVGLIVRSHHERWDGGGYPDRLAGDAIPLEARIIACCDTYNAMTTKRSYRAALPPAVAAQEIRDCAGSQFDPAIAEAVLAIVEPEPLVSASPPHERAATEDRVLEAR